MCDTMYYVMRMVQEAFIHVRVDQELDNELNQLAKDKIAVKSELVREALTEYVKKEKELKEIKGIVARKFAEGKISFEQAVQVLGYTEAKKVAFFVDVAKKSFEDGLE